MTEGDTVTDTTPRARGRSRWPSGLSSRTRPRTFLGSTMTREEFYRRRDG